MFTTLIRPSVARSLALIPQYAASAVTYQERMNAAFEADLAKARQEQQECTDRKCPAGHRFGVSHLHLDVL